MSIRIMSDVWELDLPRDEKIVLLAFADHCNDEGFCYPSVSRIARKSGYSDRSIQRKISSLVGSGLLEASSRSGGRGQTALYRVLPEKGDKLAPFAPVKGDNSTERVTPVAQKGDTAMSPEPSVNHQLEPPEEQQGFLWSTSLVREVFDYWAEKRHTALGLNGKGPRQKFTSTRQRKIKARIDEGYSGEDLKRAIDNILASEFHLKGGHTDIELICRNQAHLDRYLLMATEGEEVGGIEWAKQEHERFLANQR